MVQWNGAQLWETLTLSAAVVIDDTNADAHDINLGAQQRVGSVDVGLQFFEHEHQSPYSQKPTRTGKAVRAWGRWSPEMPLTISTSIERIDYKANRERSDLDPLQLHYALTLVYKRNMNRWALALGRASAQEQPYLHGSGGSVGWFYQLMPGVELYALSSYNRRENRRAGAPPVSATGMLLNYAK